MIDCGNIEETEKAQYDIPENYKGDFFVILLLRDLPNVLEVFTKITSEKPPYPEFVSFEYEKRFNCFCGC